MEIIGYLILIWAIYRAFWLYIDTQRFIEEEKQKWKHGS